MSRRSHHRLRHHRPACALAGLPGEQAGRARLERPCGRSPPAFSGHPRADRAARPRTGGRTVKVPGAARVERQSARYAARAQPLDWLSDRHDQSSTVPVSSDFRSAPGAPWATRRVLHRIVEVGGGGSATVGLDATAVANDVMMSALEHAAAGHALVLGLAPPRGRFHLSAAGGCQGRRRRGAPDRGRPRPPGPSRPGMRLVEVQAGGWGGEDDPHSSARDLDIGGGGASGGSVAVCGYRGNRTG